MVNTLTFTLMVISVNVHEFKSMVKQNFGDLWVNLYGGFEGYICRLRYYDMHLNIIKLKILFAKDQVKIV